MSFRVASYNALYPSYAEKNQQKEGIDANGKSNWPDVRSKQFAENMAAIDADLLLLQEMTSMTYSYFNHQRMAMKYYAETVSHDFRTGPEFMSPDGVGYFYKYKRFESYPTDKDSGKDVLFEADVVGKPEKKQHFRHLYRDLKDTVTGKVIRFATCHLVGKGNGAAAEKQHLDTVLKTVETAAKYPIAAHIIGGDFNADETHDRYQKMLQKYKFDGDLSGTERATSKKMDWLWVKTQLEANGDELLVQHVPVNLPHPAASHHLPTVMECVFASTLFKAYDMHHTCLLFNEEPRTILSALLKDKSITQASGDSLRMLREAFEKKLQKFDTRIRELALWCYDGAMTDVFTSRIYTTNPSTDFDTLLKSKKNNPVTPPPPLPSGSFIERIYHHFEVPKALNSKSAIIKQTLQETLHEASSLIKTTPGMNFEVLTRDRFVNKLLGKIDTFISVSDAFTKAYFKADDELAGPRITITKDLSGRQITVKKAGCCEWLLNIFRAIARFFQRLCSKKS